MAGSPTSFWVEVLTEDDWSRLRDIRLTALKADPRQFLANYEDEATYSPARWLHEFSRGDWNVVRTTNDLDVGLVGATREPDTPPHECDLERLWIAPEFRRIGAATMLIRAVLDRLRDSGIRTVWLWILNGNDPAMALYQQFGFQSTHEREPLPGHPAGSEERMKLRLS